MRIVVDSREKRPWKFKDSKKAHLKVGDYSIAGHEDKICIERKSVSDAINSVMSGRKRFEKEWVRAEELEYFVIIIEGGIKEIERECKKQRKYRRGLYGVNPESVIATYVKWCVKYPWCRVYFCKNRKEAEKMAKRIFEAYIKYTESI